MSHLELLIEDYQKTAYTVARLLNDRKTTEAVPLIAKLNRLVEPIDTLATERQNFRVAHIFTLGEQASEEPDDRDERWRWLNAL